MDSSRQVVERLMMSGMVKASGIKKFSSQDVFTKVELTEALGRNEDQQNIEGTAELSCVEKNSESKNPGQT